MTIKNFTFFSPNSTEFPVGSNNDAKLYMMLTGMDYGTIRRKDWTRPLNTALNVQYTNTSIIAGGRYFELLNEAVALKGSAVNYIHANIDLAQTANPVSLSAETSNNTNRIDLNNGSGVLKVCFDIITTSGTGVTHTKPVGQASILDSIYASEISLKSSINVPTISANDITLKGLINVPTVHANDITLKGLINVPTVSANDISLKGSINVPTVHANDISLKGSINVPTIYANDITLTGSINVPAQTLTVEAGNGLELQLTKKNNDLVIVRLFGSVANIKTGWKMSGTWVDRPFRPAVVQSIVGHFAGRDTSFHIDINPDGSVTWWGVNIDSNAHTTRGNGSYFIK